MTNAELLGRWGLHHRWRWIGIGIFCCALPGPAVAITSVIVKGASLKLVPLSVATLGLSLGSFGTANDTAVHALRELDRRGVEVPSEIELATEQRKRPERLAALHDSPKAAMVLPVVALGLFCWQVFLYLKTW